MKSKLQRTLFYLETIAFVVLLVIFVRTVAAVRSSYEDPLMLVADRHATQLVRRVNPEADARAVDIAALATRFALTRDRAIWHELATLAWRTRSTHEILTSRIQRIVLDETLPEREKQSRVCEVVTGTRPVGIMPGSKQSVLSALSASGINAVQIRREDGLLQFRSFDLLVIGRDAMSGTYRDYYQVLGPVLAEYVEDGGQVLILPHAGTDWAYQWLPSPILPSGRSLKAQLKGQPAIQVIEDHPVFSTVKLTDMSSGDSMTEAILETYPLASTGPGWKVYVSAMLGCERCPMLVEIKHGRGCIVICQMAIDSEYGRDPSMSELLDNLIEYLL